MQYLVELRSDTGDREDYWPVDSYVIEVAESIDATALATAANDQLAETEHFVTLELIETVLPPSPDAAQLASFMATRAKAQLIESGWLVKEE